MIWLNTVPESVQTAKQNAASAVRNRIPARVDVMIWTVMNMRRSVKNMRLIDADKLKHVIHCAYSDDLEILEKIDNQPTAFDLDKVVEQLETKETRATELKKKYISEYFKGKADAFEFAIKIVKEGGVE